jgi:hypothetical protein
MEHPKSLTLHHRPPGPSHSDPSPPRLLVYHRPLTSSPTRTIAPPPPRPRPRTLALDALYSLGTSHSRSSTPPSPPPRNIFNIGPNLLAPARPLARSPSRSRPLSPSHSRSLDPPPLPAPTPIAPSPPHLTRTIALPPPRPRPRPLALDASSVLETSHVRSLDPSSHASAPSPPRPFEGGSALSTSIPRSVAPSPPRPLHFVLP